MLYKSVPTSGADAILPKGHERQEKTGYKFDAGFVLQ
jgi:hypothetical protein